MATGQKSEVMQLLRTAVLLRDEAGLADGELLKDYISRREEAAFAALVRRHGPMVWGVCRRVLCNRHDVEDAFQATFLVLVRKAASIASPMLLANWLYGVAHQTAIKARATTAKRRAREKQVTEMPEPAATEQDFWYDLQPLLDQELSRLPDKYRVAIVLCDLQGKTRKEAAGQLSVPEGTVAARLARGRVMLAKRLARHGLTVSGGALSMVLSQSVAWAGVPNSLVIRTIKAAGLFSVGPAPAAGLISPEVAALTKGVLNSMVLSKLRTAMAVSVLVAFTGIGVSVGLPMSKRVAAAEQEPSVAMHRTRANTDTVTANVSGANVPANSPTPLANSRERAHPEDDGQIAPSTHPHAGAPGGRRRAIGDLPHGWFLSGFRPENYEVTRDEAVKHRGLYSCRIQSKVPPSKGWNDDLKMTAMLTQTFRAERYRGKRVRLSGYIRAEGLRGDAHLWMRVDNDETLFGDDPGDQPVTGTSGWLKRELILDVPQPAEYVHIGLVVAGKGKAWFDGLDVEVVGSEVAPTNALGPARYAGNRPRPEAVPGPTNLSFEDALQNR